jgi:hypothetical protein
MWVLLLLLLLLPDCMWVLLLLPDCMWVMLLLPDCMWVMLLLPDCMWVMLLPDCSQADVAEPQAVYGSTYYFSHWEMSLSVRDCMVLLLLCEMSLSAATASYGCAARDGFSERCAAEQLRGGDCT